MTYNNPVIQTQVQENIRKSSGHIIAVGILLGAMVVIAVYAGSPMFGGFDQLR